MGDVMNDVRAIWRGWRRHPVIQVACVLLLTLGIGGNAVVFAAIESLLISPLAVDRPSSLVSFGRLSYPNYRSFAQRLDGVEGVAAFANASMMRTDGVPESIRMAFVSANYFAVLGVAPIRGRAFDWDSDPAEAIRERDALISERFWRVAYAADPAVMGRTLRLNDVAVTVVGVVPAGVSGYDARPRAGCLGAVVAAIRAESGVGGAEAGPSSAERNDLCSEVGRYVGVTATVGGWSSRECADRRIPSRERPPGGTRHRRPTTGADGVRPGAQGGDWPRTGASATSRRGGVFHLHGECDDAEAGDRGVPAL